MAGDPLKKVQAGDSLTRSHESFNFFIDAAVAEKTRQDNTGQGKRPDFRQTGIVWVQNDSGATVERFGVLGIDGPIITSADNDTEFFRQVTVVGKTPDPDLHSNKFVILLEPLEDGKIARVGVISGAVQVQIYINDTDHRFADVVPPVGTASGVTGYLSSGAVGSARILWIAPPVGTEAATGLHWAIVNLGVEDPQQPFGVTVVKDGGVAGSPAVGTVPAVNCSWTYTVSDLAGYELDTGVSPEQARYPGFIYLEAGAGGRSAYGLAVWTTGTPPLGTIPGSEGTLVLMYLPGERPDATVC